MNYAFNEAWEGLFMQYDPREYWRTGTEIPTISGSTYTYNSELNLWFLGESSIDTDQVPKEFRVLLLLIT